MLRGFSCAACAWRFLQGSVEVGLHGAYRTLERHDLALSNATSLTALRRLIAAGEAR